ncbi:hypothetical protein [Ralstonia phage RSP15]|uniref:hypothetical protein n=1 Tax=Ralstonia phage RSP15 TaxID=1785960 RepID=UPI00074D2A46|nr:hypothetical protein BH754_gp121 [Ralstonia phage RSP15]BAU40185.1 hypothetical protein [Ralstonia phage RSP15]
MLHPQYKEGSKVRVRPAQGLYYYDEDGNRFTMDNLVVKVGKYEPEKYNHLGSAGFIFMLPNGEEGLLYDFEVEDATEN